MAGYLGTKAVLLSTTAATVTGDMTVGGAATISGAFTSKGIDDNAAATAMTLDASGNVGIGTTTPTALLHLSSSAVSGTDVYLSKIDTFGSGFFGTQCSNLAGSQPDWSIVTGNNEPLLFKQSTTERMRIDASGNVLVGKTAAVGSSTVGHELRGDGIAYHTSTGTCVVLNRTTTGSITAFKNNDITVGSISVTGSATAYNTSSDYRLKDNITPVQGAADIVKRMRPCTYTFKSDGSWADGFLAHELQELHPSAVVGSKDAMVDEEYEVTPAVYEDVIIPAVDAVVEVPAVYDDEGALVSEMVPAVEAQPERTEQRLVSEAVMGTRSVPDYQGVDYSKLTPILTAALQEALNKIDALEARLTALEAV